MPFRFTKLKGRNDLYLQNVVSKVQASSSTKKYEKLRREKNITTIVMTYSNSPAPMWVIR